MSDNAHKTSTTNYTPYTKVRLSAPEPAGEQTGGEFQRREMTLNMGPQHPSTHGVLRLEIVTDGELVRHVTPHLGYMHRCYEKHAENLTFQQNIPFVDRIDYLGPLLGEHAFVMAVEELAGLTGTLDKRVEYIRVLVCELNRIASHLLAIGTFGIDLGATTAFLWCLRDREHILNLLEWTSGARLLYNYLWVGGLYYDIPLGFEDRCGEFVDYMAPRIDELDTLLTDNAIFRERTAGVGVLPMKTAINYGVTGTNLRASGLAYDLRKIDGYSIYPELDFSIPTGQGIAGEKGDAWDRYWVRVQEMRECLKIISQCVDKLTGEHKRTPGFDPRAGIPKRLKFEHEEIYFRTETARGVTGFYIQTQPRKDIPLRCKCRGPSFSNLSVLPAMTENVLISDLVTILGSLDIVLCEIDR